VASGEGERGHPSGRRFGRRDFLADFGSGLGGVALTQLLGSDGLLAADRAARTEQAGSADPEAGEESAAAPIRPHVDAAQPHAARPPHFAPRAKNVLMIFCSGALSHVDTFDHKPELERRDGQPLPGAEGLVTFQGAQGNLTRSPWTFRPRGECGKPVSDLVPHLGALVDDLCFLHGLTSRTNTHGPGENFLCTGNTLEGFPSAGAWVSYALGSESAELPAYVAVPDPRGAPQSSGNCWGSGYLPAAFQGTDFNAARPVRNLARPADIPTDEDDAVRGFLLRRNRLQLAVPRIADLSSESARTAAAYGADAAGGHVERLTAAYARNCLLARRLIEQGVRFVQLFNGAYQTGGEGTSNWDGHKQLRDQYSVHGPVLDRPTAALLRDLKERGLLAETLVVFCTEFGRMPTFQKGASGRDHNPAGFTAWLAGAGVKAPFSYGATDEFGYRAVEHATTVYDFYATILHLLGLDHRRLTYYHNGLERRLTDVHGRVLADVLA
jgi:hypothetical protein